MEQPRVGFALTGSFCTLDKALLAMEETAAAYPNIVPILSETTGSTDTRFGRGADFRSGGGGDLRPPGSGIHPGGGAHRAQAAAGCAGHRSLHREHLGQTGRRHRRHRGDHGGQGPSAERPAGGGGGVHQRRPGGAARNIGELLSRKHYYFVPFRQDDPVGKPTSLVAEMGLVTATVAAALRGSRYSPCCWGRRGSEHPPAGVGMGGPVRTGAGPDLPRGFPPDSGREPISPEKARAQRVAGVPPPPLF